MHHQYSLLSSGLVSNPSHASPAHIDAYQLDGRRRRRFFRVQQQQQLQQQQYIIMQQDALIVQLQSE
eukprot:6337132-Karenia_brevis.AAC.1